MCTLVTCVSVVSYKELYNIKTLHHYSLVICIRSFLAILKYFCRGDFRSAAKDRPFCSLDKAG
jgi:hypothetical protein